MGQQASPGGRRGPWLALTAALLGWMFDGFEMGLFPLVARPALRDLLGTAQEGLVSLWFSVATAAFLVGAATGGVLFGWLGDRIGRVRAMVLSILTYAVFSGLCGAANAAWQIAVFRLIAALGMGGEWSLGVALVMEVWPDRSRGMMAGLIGAASNVGFLLIALFGLGLNQFLGQAHDWLAALGLPGPTVDALVAHSGWRLLMFFGAAPALLTLFIALWVRESHRWQEEHRRGTTSNWATRDLLGVLVGGLGAGLIIFAWEEGWDWWLRIPATLVGLGVAAVGYTYPVVRYLQRSGAGITDPAHTLRPTLARMLMGACLSGVALLGTWGATQWIPLWADQMAADQNTALTCSAVGAPAALESAGSFVSGAKNYAQIWSALGAILGTIGGALVGSWLGRRFTYVLLCAGSLGSALILYKFTSGYGAAFLAAVFLVGALTASFYGWLPLYLPELFRTGVRATGQGFSYNFGRILAAIGGLVTGFLMKDVFQGSYPQALMVISLIYVVGIAVIWFAPETHGKPLPE